MCLKNFASNLTATISTNPVSPFIGVTLLNWLIWKEPTNFSSWGAQEGTTNYRNKTHVNVENIKYPKFYIGRQFYQQFEVTNNKNDFIRFFGCFRKTHVNVGFEKCTKTHTKHIITQNRTKKKIGTKQNTAIIIKSSKQQSLPMTQPHNKSQKTKIRSQRQNTYKKNSKTKACLIPVISTIFFVLLVLLVVFFRLFC